MQHVANYRDFPVVVQALFCCVATIRDELLEALKFRVLTQCKTKKPAGQISDEKVAENSKVVRCLGR